MKTLFLILFFTISLKFSVPAVLNTENDDLNFWIRLKEPPVRPLKPVTLSDTVYEAWIKQKLDNFDQHNTNRFHMKYLYNRQHFKPGGPILIVAGGEWTITEGLLQFGHIHDMAKALNGLILYTEHRYYGETRPTSDLSLENLRFLSIDQALADLAHFISFIKNAFPGAQNSGVILVGCSYSATMVTWFRQKYPHLVNGAWALSGPLLAQVDFTEYMEVVSHAIQKVGGEKCSNRIRKAYEQMEALVDHGNATELSRILKLCTPLNLDNKLDIWTLFRDITIPWATFVATYSVHDQNIEIPCEKLLAIETASDAEAYAKWVLEISGITENKCYDHEFATKMDLWSRTDYNATSGWRQWYYQTCSQFGWYQSSNSDDILFGNSFPVNISIQFCNGMFNNSFPMRNVEANAQRTNLFYGGKYPDVRNVYSTHGEYDPWAPMGVDKDINGDSPVVILPGESHCSDLNSISSRDTPEMKASKERIFMLIQKWLGIPSENWITLPIV